MVTALLGIPVVVFAAACGVAVYRTGQSRPAFRGLVTFGLLLVTPVVTFGLLSAGLTSELPVPLTVLPIALLGLGLYIIAEGAPPSFGRRREPAE